MFDDLPPAPKKPPDLSPRLKELAQELADALRQARMADQVERPKG